MGFDRLFGPNIDKLKNSRDTNGLINALAHKDESVRVNAIKALGELDSPEAVGPLIKCLDDPSDVIRGTAISVLGKNRNYQAIDSIIKRTSDDSENVRKAAIRALGKFGTHAAVEPLIKLLDDGSGDVRNRAEEALEKIIKTISAESPKNFFNPEFLMSCQKSENGKIRFYATSVLAKIKCEAAVDSLICDLEDENEDVRTTAVGNLVLLGDTHATAPLIKGLRDENLAIRLGSIATLMKLKDPDALGILISSLNNCPEDEFKALLLLLQYEKIPGFVEYYASNVSSCDASTRSMSLAVFQKLFRSERPNDEIHAAFDKYLSTNDNDVYFDTARALFNTFGVNALPEIVIHMEQRLTDGDPGVRSLAIETIGSLGTDYRLAKLLIDRLTNDSESNNRFKAAKILGNFKGIEHDGKMVEAFNRCIRNDPDERVCGALMVILNRPDKIDQLYNTAVAFYRLYMYNEAVEAFDKYLEKRPSDAQAWNNKGACLMELKRYAEAEHCFEKALGIDINYRAAQENAMKCRLIIRGKL